MISVIVRSSNPGCNLTGESAMTTPPTRAQIPGKKAAMIRT
jgi:hypothetical protein